MIQVNAARAFRLQRSMLSVPAINPKLFDKGLNSDADVIMLDCEDSVAFDDKGEARRNVIDGLLELDWRGAKKGIVVRVNGLDTPFMYRDVVDIAEAAGDRLDGFVLPKVNQPSDIQFLATLLDQVELHTNQTRQIGIEALIETASGAANLNEIAKSSPRLEALHFGAGDFAASCRARTVSIGGVNARYPGDQWHYILQRIVIAARANGLRAIDSAYGDFNDESGFVQALERASALGFEGKWAIHPKQIEPANRLMSPDRESVHEAMEIIAAMKQAARENRGATTLNGKMIDVASIRMAQHIVDMDSAIADRCS